MDKENKLILYKDDEGKVNVNVRFADENVWLTREHLAEIYVTTPLKRLKEQDDDEDHEIK